MDGIQSLMQGAPPQNAQQGMPQGQQGPQGPQGMPMPNDPRMGAAMGLVDDSVEKFNLDPQTEALMLKNQALDLLKAADNVGKMNAPPQDTNIQEQTEQGIVGMLQSLSPGMQQRGQQMQRSQARQTMGGGMPARPPMPQQNMARPPRGGMPSMGATTMQRMANGGIVGYQDGGFLGKVKGWDTKLNQAHDARQNERLARGKSFSDYSPLDPYNSLSNAMYDTGIAGALQKLTGYESQLDKPVEEDPTVKQLRNFMAVQDAFKARKAAGAGEEELRRIREDLNSYTSIVPNIEADAARARGGMARGGIIGYKPGGPVMLDTKYGSVPSYSPDSAAFLVNRDAGRAEAQGKATAKSDLLRTLSREEATRFASLIQELGNQDQALSIIAEERKRPDVGNVAGIAGMLAGQKESPFRVQGMAEKTPVGTQYDPTGRETAGLPFGAAGDTFDPPVGALTPAATAPATAQAAPREEYTPSALDLLVDKQLEDALNADPNDAATTRGDRVRDLTGFDDLMARRIAAEKSVRDQKESRLNPEQTRKRRLQAGLAGLAAQGLGGFSAGRTAEMDKIAAERLGIEETSLANLNSLIAEKRAMGMSQFEAENSARAEILASRDTATTAAGRRGDARRTAFNTAQENELDRAATADQNRLNRANQFAVAEMQVAGGNETDLARRIQTRKAEIKDANPELSQTEINSRALDMVEAQETSAALARVGIQATQGNFARYKAAADLVIKRITNDINWSTLSAVEKQSVYETAIDDEMANIARTLGDTPSTRNSNTPPLTSFDGS